MAEKLRFYSSAADNLDAMAVDTDSSVATPSNVKSDYLFKDASTREIMTGTMPVNPSVSIKLDPIYDGSKFLYGIPLIYNSGWKYNSWNITYTGNNRANIAIAGNAIVG